jgi:hypothetical protein
MRDTQESVILKYNASGEIAGAEQTGVIYGQGVREGGGG